ncbi:MAG: Unknown protein [uncultured Sulfurovum sp.]|uniref:DUF3972 domain-containing protein n=1 Tax=uncultured Sulfurovum sp. TaxID=269237 RepID=A0A6S6SAH1_9BACT|nr:MAG: Unknown protein [uncultured Sulfurovum sp.]
MKPAEYAQAMGISRQAVYAKIKRGILTSKSVDGKLYVVIDNDELNAQDETDVSSFGSNKTPTKIVRKSTQSQVNKSSVDYKSLLQAKDETISVLKGTVKDLKKSNKQISTTLKGEIDLLKDAFHEMRTLYLHQLEYKKSDDTIEVETEENDVQKTQDVDVQDEETKKSKNWISVKKFFKKHELIKLKQQEKCIKRIKKLYKKGDDRLMVVKDKIKLNDNANYEDILN